MKPVFLGSMVVGTIVLGCSGAESSTNPASSGGSVGIGGTSSVGGSAAVGGAPSSGGAHAGGSVRIVRVQAVEDALMVGGFVLLPLCHRGRSRGTVDDRH